jgi:hypothetical protein
MLFVVFTSDSCRRNHAFMWAIDLARHGHEVRVLLEGEGTGCLREREGRFGELFEEARGLGLIAGACEKASAGCKEESRSVTEIAKELGLPLIGTLGGHASVEPFVRDGFEMVVF